MAALDDGAIDHRQTIAALRRELDQCIAERDEALAQQFATSEILGVISCSPTDTQPVFEAIVARAAALCEAEFSAVARLEDGLLHLVAVHSMSPEEMAAFHSLFPRPPTRNFTMGRAFVDSRPVHFADVLTEFDYDTRTIEVLQSVAKYRSFLGVPIFREGRPIGVIGCGRREVRPFAAAQIDLVKTFADQAAIAIENVRLFGELEIRNRDLGEALEQQTATAEILEVINRSPGNLAPVFEAMVERAVQLCEADEAAVRSFDGKLLHLVAAHGEPDVLDKLRELGPSDLSRPGGLYDPFLRGERVVHIADVRETETFRDKPIARKRLEVRNIRTWLAVGLRREGKLLGVINVHRHEVRPFSEKQIALLENFAAQAVIAIENARLLGELRQRTGDLQKSLEYQTATSDVLKVISRSTFDLQPVFETIVGTAARLCDADTAFVSHREGDAYRVVASFAASPEFGAFIRGRLLPVSRGNVAGRTVLEGRVVHVDDIAADPEFNLPASVTIGKLRTALGVPLLREGVVVGTINLGRTRVQPFTDRQIELVRTFADQAVIALENARLFTELRESLEQQQAIAEVLQVINSSPGELAPVFEAMLERATRLCEAASGIFWIYDGTRFRAAAFHGLSALVVEQLCNNPDPIPTPSLAAIARGETVVRNDKLTGPPGVSGTVELDGMRTGFLVALRKGDTLLGAIRIFRQDARPFAEKQIALVENFAAQAVIAMENARLLTETREALEQQTATAEVLQVINASPGNLEPVFSAILDKAHTLCGATLGSLFLFDGEVFRAAATHGYPEDLAQRLRKGVVLSAAPQLLADGVRWVHNPDLTLLDTPTARAVSGRGGVRTNLMLPLRKDGRLLGAISCNRQEVRPFTEKEIALLENFAAQAVIAIENARLLKELRERTRDLEESLEYQTRTSDVLKVISGSTFDLQPVLDTLLETAARLCDAEMGHIAKREGDAYRVASTFAFSPEWDTAVRRLTFTPGRGSIVGRTLLARETVQIADLAADPEYALPEVVTIGKMRTGLGVPLLREGDPIGVIYLARQRVEPFTEKQIELVRTFADQAVIAIENTRLITETHEALEQQTATAEVLQVINSSPGDLAPVFEAMLDKAMRLSEAAFGQLAIYEDGTFRTAANAGDAGCLCRISSPQSPRLRPGDTAGAPSRRRAHHPRPRPHGRRHLHDRRSEPSCTGRPRRRAQLVDGAAPT